MPTTRKRIPRSRLPVETYPPWQISYLKNGSTDGAVCNPFEILEFKFSKDKQLAAWRACRSKIMYDWLKARPGTRPLAWWLFEAPGLRRKLSKKGPADAVFIEMQCGTIWGIPDWYDDPHNVKTDRPAFESQAAYLKRLGLMAKSEERCLKPDDFEPESPVLSMRARRV